MPTQDDRRALVDLLPQFLMRRRRGWTALNTVLSAFGLERPAFFLLQAIVQELDRGMGMSEAELRAHLFNPYSTYNPIFDYLPALVDKGYLRVEDERYAVTVRGHDVIMEIEHAARDYVASLQPLPPDDLVQLADALSTIAERLSSAAEPADKTHGARLQRLPIPTDSPPMVRLEHAVFGLWTARDDAHNAAWRAAGFDGPPFDLLTRVWTGEATTLQQLKEAVAHTQRPQDVARGIEALIARDYLRRDGERLQLTPRGQATRDAVEAETDRIYFAPWPPFSAEELAWLRQTLQTTTEQLPTKVVHLLLVARMQIQIAAVLVNAQQS